jgi:hypothetical protein
MGGVEQRLDLDRTVALLGILDEVAGVVEIFENALGVGPLPEQMVRLEEVVVAEGRVGEDQRPGPRSRSSAHRHVWTVTDGKLTSFQQHVDTVRVREQMP